MDLRNYDNTHKTFSQLRTELEEMRRKLDEITTYRLDHKCETAPVLGLTNKTESPE